ncbi:uncharacterized protein RCO7_11532 [Rhynchosporium graminicola]|uniref:Uncharacterized protein n=1 Tax=Rhynchosporium graminicola TaxID=2792576 RepID=A0A1E1LT90_9HELO|nr:uncharacterized protein RCO7_11532 [Rhynchosporium commune]
MCPPRNPFVPEGRRQGEAGPSSGALITGKRRAETIYTPVRRGWQNTSRPDPPSSISRVLEVSNGQNNSLPEQEEQPDFSAFGFPSSQSRSPRVHSMVSEISPFQSVANLSLKSFDYDWSSSVASSDVGIEERHDDHSSQEIDISSTYEYITIALEASHSKIQHRLESVPMISATETIHQHLELATPPNSPSLALQSPRSPDTQVFLRNLQDQTLQDLIQSDKQLHEHVKEITSIREWWTANKIIWRQQKAKLDDIQSSIDVLEDRQFKLTLFQSTRNDIASNDNTFAYLPQIEEQIKAKNPLLAWFRANDLQMKQVYAQYKALTTQINNLSPASKSPKELPIYTVQSRPDRRLSFVYSDRTQKVESLPWYQARRLVNWAVPAKRDNAVHLQKMVVFADEVRAEMNRLVKRIEKLELKMRQQDRENNKRNKQAEERVYNLDILIDSGSRDISSTDRDAVLNKRQNELLREMAELQDNRAKGKILLKRKDTVAFMKDLMEIEAERASTVGHILSYIIRRETETQGKGASELDNMNLVNDMYAICWLHSQRRIPRHELLSYLQDDTRFLGENRVEILNIAKTLYTKHGSARRQLDRITNAGGLGPDSIRNIRRIYEDENIDYNNMMEDIQSVHQKRDFVKAPQTRNAPILPNADYLIRPKLSLLGTGLSTSAATAILAEEYLFERQPQKQDKSSRWDGIVCNHDVLTRFFTSPDIFPIFRNENSSWTFEGFVAVVNSLVATPFTSEVLGAFLHYSHRFRQLFRITYLTNRIKISQSRVTGWEICEELPVDGPIRTVRAAESLKKPTGLENIEALLLENVEEFRREPREEIPGNLFDRIKRWPPKRKLKFFRADKTIKDEKFRRYLMYWSITGTYFVYENPFQVNDQNYLEQRIIRVDNGWPVAWDTEYEIPSPLPILSIMTSQFKDIEKNIYDAYSTNVETYNMIQAMQTDIGAEFQWVLYNQIFNQGAPTAFLSQRVSRQTFHLFLRNCREKNMMFT